MRARNCVDDSHGGDVEADAGGRGRVRCARLSGATPGSQACGSDRATPRAWMVDAGDDGSCVTARRRGLLSRAVHKGGSVSLHIPHEHSVVAPIPVEPGGNELGEYRVPCNGEADALLARIEFTYRRGCPRRAGRGGRAIMEDNLARCGANCDRPWLFWTRVPRGARQLRHVRHRRDRAH
eukprot:scaffold26460_cov27-Tisochrysis_lutea.AAC.7